MEFTTVRSKEKDYNIYLKSEKLVQEHEKNVSQLWKSKKLVPSYFEPEKNWWIPTIRRLKHGVHNCQVLGKRL